MGLVTLGPPVSDWEVGALGRPGCADGDAVGGGSTGGLMATGELPPGNGALAVTGPGLRQRVNTGAWAMNGMGAFMGERADVVRFNAVIFYLKKYLMPLFYAL